MDEITKKRCSKCGEVKALGEYSKDKRRVDGLDGTCRACKSEVFRQWRKNNPDKAKATVSSWRENHKDHCSDYGKKYRSDKKDHYKELSKAWWAAHPGLKKKIYENNKDKAIAYYRKRKRENPERIREISRRSSAKLLSTPKGILNRRVSTAIRNSISSGMKAGRHWEDLVGYTVDDLKRHLEKQFLPGMSWENRGEWEIDHKTPLSAFNFQGPEDIDFKKAWALKNLQPLWRPQNRSKHARLDRPFQPSLALSA